MPHPLPRFLTTLLAAPLLLTLLTAPLAARDDAAPEPIDDLTRFIDTVDVNIVNLDVFVTDKKGERITGLTKDDFELFVDGDPAPISNFYAVEGGMAKIVPEGIAPVEVPEFEDPRLRPERPPLPENQQLHLVVYVDNLNLRPFNRNRVLGAARTFLRQRMQPGDQVMLVTFERSMHIRQPFTADPELVAGLLYDIEEMAASAIHYDSDRRDIMQAIDEAQDIYDVRGRVFQYAESLYNDMDFTIRALSDLTESLAGLPGRKAILYVSDGLPLRPAEDMFHAMDQAFTDQHTLIEIHRYDLTREFQRLTSTANTNRVTFYTVDAAGLRTYSYMDASNQTANANAAFIDQVHFSNLQSPLILMAQETGGLVAMNTNNHSLGMDKMAEDFENYYSLGFSPGETVSGRYHRIEIKLKNSDKKLRVRYREGFRSKPVETRMVDSTLAALNYGYEKNPLGIDLELGRESPQDGKRKRFLLPVRVKIPLGNVAFLPQQGMHRGRIRLFIAAQDEEGGQSEVQNVEIPINIPESDFELAQGQFWGYDITLQMRPGRQIVAVGVRDEIGALTGFVTRATQIGQ